MIVVGATMTAYALLDPERSYLHDAWLRTAKEIQASVDDEVRFFAALQFDGRGHGLFEPVLDLLTKVGGAWWFYSLDDGRKQVTGENRGRHLCTGLNLISEYATSVGAHHLLQMAADCEPPADVLPRLLEVRSGIVAAACSTYFGDYSHPFFTSEPAADVYPFPVVGPPMTSVCCLIHRDVFKRLKWRWDGDLGLTDDPAYTKDGREMLGVKTLTRLDCVATHHPAAIGPVDDRYPGLDMGVAQI